MIIVRNVKMPINTDFSNFYITLSKVLKIDAKIIKTATLYRKSIDARHKNDICFCCSFLLELHDGEDKFLKKNRNAEIFVKKEYVWKTARSDSRPVVVGFGPAGMFAALTLSRAGLRPIVIERGSDADTRAKQIEEFFLGGKLNPQSNVQFGEGGAGTFSDGKLNTGIKDIRCRTVLETFVSFGASDKILYEAKPHIGTDVLINVVKNIRKEIIKLGGEVFFNTCLERINTFDKKIVSVEANGKTIDCSKVVLATGHSARDVFELLNNINVALQQKPFAVGARIEHLQTDINRAMYGKFAESEYLGAADYKLAVHLPSGRGVYTFCMCPGGKVINASSEIDGIAVNGMSYSARNLQNANSALLVEVKPQDLMEDDIFAGVRLQKEIEQKAYNIANGSVPFCFVGDLLNQTVTDKEKVKPTVKPDTVHTDIYKVLPSFVADSIKAALPEFDKKINGFADNNARLTFPETRSSSPIRVLRNEFYESVSLSGLYPTGEGAGYAGGIMSAAVDGMRVAEQVIDLFS